MNEETVHRMKQMKLLGMAAAFQASFEQEQMANLTNDQIISMLIEAEWDDRNNRRIERRLRQAKFRYIANMEQILFNEDRNLDKNQLMRLAECSFIDKAENIMITGKTGVGKSYIASALGNQACTLGYKAIYANTGKLMSRLKMAKADGSYLKEIARIEKHDLLILDDFGLQPFDNLSRSALMEIVEDRHSKRSTIITSQWPISDWHEIIGEQTLADAILDRIVHSSHRMELLGPSLREKLSGKQTKMIELH
jgi:DNA replication protein DnaC